MWAAARNGKRYIVARNSVVLVVVLITFIVVNNVQFNTELTDEGYTERERTNLFSDFIGASRVANSFDPKTDDVQSVAGNFVIVEIEKNIYAALCHLQTGSVQVTVGQHIKAGDVIGKVGHSGNSFGPHLHFQLIDSSDIETAKGLPCAFERYEVYQGGEWVEVINGIPTDKERIRYVP